MPIFCRKNVHSLRNTVLLCQLKKNHEKPSAIMPIFDKKSILSKQYYIMSQRSQQDALFLRFLTKKLSLLCPYFVKNVHSLNSHANILTRKRLSSQKQYSHVIRFKFFIKNPCCHAHIWSKKRKFCQNYTMLRAKKDNRIPFFMIFHEKILLSCPYFVKKTSIL